MQPLSLQTRQRYFYFLFAVFILVVPFLILFSLGYRFDGGLSLVSTGGLYIATDVSGASIFIDDEQVRETGTFRRAFFIQNIAPGPASVHVQKDGYHAWTKEFTIEPHIVTEAATFLLPLAPTLRAIPALVEVPGADDGPMVPQLNSEYVDLLESFGFVATTTVATRTVPARLALTKIEEPESDVPLAVAVIAATTTVERRGVALLEDAESVIAMWLRLSEEPPYFFCGAAGECAREVVIDTAGESVRHFDFFPGRNDLVIVSRESGVFATEIDSRGWQNTQPIMEGADLDFRISERGALYIKDGELLYEVIL